MLANMQINTTKCTSEQTAEINEYCESIYNANEQMPGTINSSALTKAFDWEALQSHLAAEDRADINREVKDLLFGPPDLLWKQRLTTEKQSFWLIVRAWMVHVTRTLVFINEV
jgi:replication initiation and membrane attachment protein DnaB